MVRRVGTALRPSNRRLWTERSARSGWLPSVAWWRTPLRCCSNLVLRINPPTLAFGHSSRLFGCCSTTVSSSLCRPTVFGGNRIEEREECSKNGLLVYGSVVWFERRVVRCRAARCLLGPSGQRGRRVGVDGRPERCSGDGEGGTRTSRKEERWGRPEQKAI